MTDYKQGEADKTHLNSIFGTREDSPTPETRTNALSSNAVKAALLSANKIPAVVAVAAVDANDDGDFEDEGDVQAVEAVVGDLREAAVYWYDANKSSDEYDSKVNLNYSDAPSFNSADYDINTLRISPYGPNLNIPTINNNTIGAFTRNADNSVLVIPSDFNPSSRNFGTNKKNSNNANSNGSLKGPGQFVTSIKAKALNPTLPSTDRAFIPHEVDEPEE